MKANGSEYYSSPTRAINPGILMPEDVVVYGTVTGSQYAFHVTEPLSQGDLNMPQLVGALDKIAGGQINTVADEVLRDSHGRLVVKLNALWPSIAINSRLRFIDARDSWSDSSPRGLVTPTIWQLELLPGPNSHVDIFGSVVPPQKSRSSRGSFLGRCGLRNR